MGIERSRYIGVERDIDRGMKGKEAQRGGHREKQIHRRRGRTKTEIWRGTETESRR